MQEKVQLGGAEAAFPQERMQQMFSLVAQASR